MPETASRHDPLTSKLDRLKIVGPGHPQRGTIV
jgi:hypothetical protein